MIEDIALLRRTIYGRRVPPAEVFVDAEGVTGEIERAPVRRAAPRRDRFEKPAVVDGAANTRFSRGPVNGKRGTGRRRPDGPAQPEAEATGRSSVRVGGGHPQRRPAGKQRRPRPR